MSFFKGQCLVEVVSHSKLKFLLSLQFGETLEKEHGRGRWLGVYGGDTFIGEHNVEIIVFEILLLKEHIHL